MSEAKKLFDKAPVGWEDVMADGIGATVKILQVDTDDTILVEYESGRQWWWPTSVFQQKAEDHYGNFHRLICVKE